MATITEDFVSFETAKLLKEKGFKTELTTFYYSNGMFSHGNTYSFVNNELKINPDIILAPSLALAMKWLRKVHGLFISIGNDDLDYNWQIFDIENRTEDLDPLCLTDSYAGYEKYEQACEAAIKYCLENLI